MEHCRSPDGVTSVSVRPYYTMLSRVYLVLAMGFLVLLYIVFKVVFHKYRFFLVTGGILCLKFCIHGDNLLKSLP